MSHKRATVVVPIYNEADGVSSAIPELLRRELAEECDVIIVDDGSDDGTGDALSRFESETGKFRLVRHEENRGYGASLKSGISEATTEYVVITDADNSYPNDRIPELVAIARDEGYDMVVGARTTANAQIPLIRRPAKWALRALANYLARKRIPDLNSGLRVFRRDIVLDHLNLLCDGFSFTSTLTLIMLCNNYRVKYVPIEYFKRTGRSKIRPIRDTLNFVVLILTTVYYFRPLRVLLPPGLLLLLTGLALGVYQAVAIRNVTTVTVLFILSGFAVFGLALLSDLIVKSRWVRHPLRSGSARRRAAADPSDDEGV